MTQTNDTTTLCECGCGLPAPISPYTSAAKGYIKGQPRRFRKGHHLRSSGVDYVIEDRGYKTPCWIFQRSVTKSGYGNMWDETQQRLRPAHVVYFERNHGPTPDGMEHDHLCRVRACINPDHIERVTPTVNARRGAKPKLTEENARWIRQNIGLISQTEMAQMLGVTVACVNHVVHGITWREIT